MSIANWAGCSTRWSSWGCGTTPSLSSRPTTANSWETRGRSARAACSRRATTYLASFVTPGTLRCTVPPSTSSQRASTSCRPSARPSGSRCPPSATGSRSLRSSGASSPRGGVRSRTGSTTGGGSASCSGRIPGRGTVSSSRCIWRSRVRRRRPTYSWATANGVVSTWPLTPHGGSRSTELARVLEQAQAMLAWRANHADRTFTDMLVMNGGVGRLPQRLD